MPRTLLDGYASSRKKANLTASGPKVGCEAFGLAANVLLLAALACRPVLTIGWGEMFFIIALLLIVIGPPLYRLFRRLEEFRRHERENEQNRRERDKSR